MKTADPELMRAINRFHVLDVVRRRGPISRVEIVQHTELAPATISAITGGLIEENLILARAVEGVGTAARGRPRVMLELNREAAFVCGVKLAPHQISIAVTDYTADVVQTLSLPIRVARQAPGVVADILEDGIRRCVGDADLGLDRLGGIGIGLPGFIDGRSGTCVWTPILGTPDVPLAAMIQDRLGIRTIVENDVHLVTLAEHWFGQGRDSDTFAVVTVEDSVGLGLFLNGEVHRGAAGMGTEFGHTKMALDGLPCRCGQRGCIDAYVSDHGIVTRARALLGAEAGTIAPEDPRAIGRLRDMARAGRADIRALFEEAGAILGFAVGNLITLHSPPKVIVAGSAIQARDLMEPALLATIDRIVPAPIRRGTEIILHEWSDDAWARGAASLVLRQLYESPWNGQGRAR
ncbi:MULTISPECIES: ROK family protein [Inquilinus]|uniref:NBD/HSP70 family sugar kinase n=1 Tax=Inquilinus ginsengisoli TaxID=363840 RepID=A0ABU1K126_9PROT|nr:ROK family protein [Inquilinus ginsengisoli]MDR6293494.1 putative NBD/HSP70 family sugar kinase [Inquilinus ginsengisoli]